VIIFDKFGGGQSERNRSVPVSPNNPMRIVTRVSPLRLLVLMKKRHPSLREPRVASHEPRMPISNRELDLLERPLSHCKQRKATVSNRELSTIRDSTGIDTANSSQVSEGPSSAAVSDLNSRKLTPFLTGSGSQTEFAVTCSRQTLKKFLTGARTAMKVAQFRPEFEPKSQAQREKECRSRDAAEQGKLPLHIRNAKELS
jgi:hypothetical protein